MFIPDETAVQTLATISHVHLVDENGVAQFRIKCQRRDQFGAGQMAHLVTMHAWGAACPARPVGPLSGRSWLRG